MPFWHILINVFLITEYILRTETLVNALKNVGEEINECLVIAMVMKGLPVEYKPFVVVMTQTEKVRTFTKFKVALRSYEENERATAKPEEEIASQIMKMNVTNKPGACFTCGKYGHKSFDCPEKPERWCKFCKTSTHTDRACYKRKRIDQAKQARETDEKSREEHTFVFAADGRYTDDDTRKQKGDGCTEVSLLVDSGASSHIVNKEEYFISYDNTFKPEKHYIELADGSKSVNTAEKKGTASLTFVDENGIERKSILSDTLYIPSYPMSIFSVPAALEAEASVTFQAENSELVTKAGVKFPIRKKGKLYYMDKCYHANAQFQPKDDKEPCSSKDKDPIENDSISAVRVFDLKTWHMILGHCNKSDVLSTEKVVEGMKIAKRNLLDCNICTLGKQTVTRNREPDQRAETPLEFVHSDLSGDVDPIGKDGFKYVMTFVDDYSSVIFVYLLKLKSDATDALRKFLADTAPFGDIKRMRTDNGGEYVSEKFKEVLVQNKIKFEPSCPHSPHQNGTAERTWRTLFGMARTLLIQAKLPKYLWTYAVKASAHIRNRCFN